MCTRGGTELGTPQGVGHHALNSLRTLRIPIAHLKRDVDLITCGKSSLGKRLTFFFFRHEFEVANEFHVRHLVVQPGGALAVGQPHPHLVWRRCCKDDGSAAREHALHLPQGCRERGAHRQEWPVHANRSPLPEQVSTGQGHAELDSHADLGRRTRRAVSF